MATSPVQAETRVRASENDECRGAALVAHLEAILAQRAFEQEGPQP